MEHTTPNQDEALKEHVRFLLRLLAWISALSAAGLLIRLAMNFRLLYYGYSGGHGITSGTSYLGTVIVGVVLCVLALGYSLGMLTYVGATRRRIAAEGLVGGLASTLGMIQGLFLLQMAICVLTLIVDVERAVEFFSKV